MNLFLNIRRFIILVIVSIKCLPLLPADCQRFNGLGYLTVEPAPLFLIGSNLTVHCHTTKCPRRQEWLTMTLNGKSVDPWKRVNCSTVEFKLINVQIPRSVVLCKLKSDQLSRIVHGLDLRGGLPPDKPENIKCETSQSSDFIDCSWEKGRETHLPRAYNISVKRGNQTQTLLDQIHEAEQVTIPQAKLDENTTYQLIITAYNHFGASQSHPFNLYLKDTVIPETPRIMQITFGNNSMVAMLRWETTESSLHLRSYVRLRSDNGPWDEEEGTEPSDGLIQVDGLKPLTEYEFQIKTCNSTSGLAHNNTLSFTAQSTASKKPSCSKWSPSVRGRSPGKGPSQKLHVWRMLGPNSTNGLRMVTVLWKPPYPEEYSGEVKHYKIFWGNGQKQEETCHAACSRCSVQVPADVQVLSISVVTSYGISPPAEVPLGHSGDPRPVLRELASAANGSALLVSWSQLGSKRSTGELLHYVLEWTSVPVTDLQWKTLDKDQKNTSIEGLTAGVRYNISLYAVTTRGVSAPSSGLVYSKEQKPKSSPTMSALVHEARRIWIQWEELPEEQQRGFITHYTIYLQTLASSHTELNVTVSSSDPRQKWLDCAEGALALQMTASTSAGEGPRGNRISSQPANTAVGLVIVIFFIITLFIMIIVNLMCWSCVRKRIKQECISWGPVWFDENLPKLGNSMAIRLLEQDKSEPCFSSNYADPPLSPISVVSQSERDDVYPIIHVEIAQAGSGQPTTETPLLGSDDPRERLLDSLLEHDSYKPQIATLVPQGDEVKETEEEGEQMDVPTTCEMDRCSGAFGGLLGSFLSAVEVGVSDSSPTLTLGSVSSLLMCQTTETTSVSNGGFFLDRTGIENDVGAPSPSMDLLQDEMMTPGSENIALSQCKVEATRTGGYFPQVAPVSSTAPCETQR